MAFVAELNGNFARPPGVHQLSSDAAVISWRTLKPKQAVLKYGADPEHEPSHHDAGCQGGAEIEITIFTRDRLTTGRWLWKGQKASEPHR